MKSKVSPSGLALDNVVERFPSLDLSGELSDLSELESEDEDERGLDPVKGQSRSLDIPVSCTSLPMNFEVLT